MKHVGAFALIGLCLLSACSRCASDPDYAYLLANGTCEDVRVLAGQEDFRDVVTFAALSASAYDYDLTTDATGTHSVLSPKRDPAGPLVNTLKDYCCIKGASFRPEGFEDAPDTVYVGPGKPAFGWDVGGLSYHVFAEKRKGSQRRVFLVFRGTDPNQFGDWYSDFRWVTRVLFFLHDEYDQLHRILPDLIKNIRAAYGQDAVIEVGGHSLGGGLAQYAAYDFPSAKEAAAGIQKVYAFDPTPVTGFYSVGSEQRKKNAQGLRIYRVYDHGEVLAYLRLVMKLLCPVSEENPKIVQVRYNLLKGNFVSQHGVRRFGCALWEQTSGQKCDPVPGN